GKLYYLRLSAVDEFNNKKPPMQLLISFSVEDVRNQAAIYTKRNLDTTRGAEAIDASLSQKNRPGDAKKSLDLVDASPKILQELTWVLEHQSPWSLVGLGYDKGVEKEERYGIMRKDGVILGRERHVRGERMAA
ncbi:hypothetical protein IFM89_033466, partial [Coptis chinensis]